MNVEVMGVNPPCRRCEAAWASVEKAASVLRSEGFDVSLRKLDIMSNEVRLRYGVVVSPAVALNGTVKIMGRVPDTKEIERLLRDAAS